MSKYDRLFEDLTDRINKSITSVQPAAGTASGHGTLEEMVKSLTERFDAVAAMLATDGPVAKALTELKGDQETISTVIEKSLERIEAVEKSGAKPHSTAGDNTGAAPAAVTDVNKSVSGEWDTLVRHIAHGGKAKLTSN